MALTRKFLSALGIEADKVDEIIEAHAETVNGLKAERDSYRDDAERLADVEKKLSEAQKQIEASGTDEYKGKYDLLQEEFKAYKDGIEAEKLTNSKREAYKAMLGEIGVSEKRIDAVLKLTDLSAIEMDGDKLVDADKLMESAKNEWADFIVETKKMGAGTQTPPPEDNGHNTPIAMPTIF